MDSFKNAISLAVLLLLLQSSAAEEHFERNASSFCRTPLFHEEAVRSASLLSYRSLSSQELSRIGKIGLDGMIVEENVGDVRSFYTIDADGGVYYWKDLDAVLRNKTDNVYVYVELTEPGGNEVWYDGANNGYITQVDVNLITQVFDQALTENDIYGIDRAVFGGERPYGVDNDSHVTLLLLDIDGDEGDNYSGGGYTAGYFYLINEYANNTPVMSCPSFGDCLYSNQRKMIFIDTYPTIDWRTATVPYEPDRNHGNDGYEGVDKSYGIIAHEFEHMIHWYHDADESVWVDEGCADYAYYVNGFGHPQEHVNGFQNSPDTQLTAWSGTIEDYGASYLWTLYLAEHYGGNATITALVNNAGNNVSGVDATLSSRGYSTSFAAVFPKWVVANYADDTNFGSGEYGYNAIDTVMNLSASKTSYPASGTGSVKNYAGEYIKFSNGNGSSLNVSFNGQDGKSFNAYVVEKTNSGVSAVSEITLDSGKAGSTLATAFGVNGKNSTLVIAGGSSAGTYSYAADYAPEVAVPTPWLLVEMTYPTASLNVSEEGSFNVSATVTCRGAYCGDVNAILDPQEYSNPNLGTLTTTSGLAATTSVPGTTSLPSTTSVAGAGTMTVSGTTTVPSTTTLPEEATTTTTTTTQSATTTTTQAGTTTTSSTTTTVLKSGAVPEGSGSPFYTLDANPAYPANFPCLASMTENDSCNVTWEVQVNGSGGPYIFYVTANSTEGAQNNSNTANVTILPPTPGALTAEITEPNASIQTLKHAQFNFTVRVNCTGGDCGVVTATLDPESSGSPFYTPDANPRHGNALPCLANMTGNSTCNVTWRLNATGTAGSTHVFYATVNSTRTQNQSSTINVTILAAPSSTENFTVDANASQPVQVNSSAANASITLSVSQNVSNETLTINSYDENPEFTVFSEPSLGTFYRIEASNALAGNLTYALLTLHYSEAWVNQSNLNESTLAIYWHNETGSLWEKISSDMDWVHETGLNETGDYAWANLTHFSTYVIGGESLSVSHTGELYLGWNLISLPVSI
ncbi:MAG: hypothetical protein ABH834_00640 [Candidatus Altiarchaeota archaeon]